MNLRKVLNFLLFLISFSCSAQKQNVIKNFNIETFNENKNNINEYTYLTKDSTRVEQNRWQFGFEEVITKNKALLSTYNKYYESGKIKFTGDFFPNDFEKGIWKEYDEQGNLIKETNYDALYKFTWEDILKLMEERGIEFVNPYLRIIRDLVDGHPYWGITWEDKQILKLRHIGIDGINGEIVQDIEKDYPIGGEYGNEEDE